MTPQYEYPHTIFSPTLVRRVGSIKEVLGAFLDKQIQSIQLSLEHRYEGVTGNSLEKLLDEFVTLEGTKKPISTEQIESVLLNQEQLEYCLKELERSRILRFEENQYELAHDTLALNIAERRSSERVQVLKAKKIFDRYDLADKNINNILAKKELQQIESIKDLLLNEKTLTEEEWQFVDKSEKIYRRRNNTLVIGSVSISLILAGLLIWALISRNIAEVSKEEARASEKKALAVQDSLQKNKDSLELKNKELIQKQQENDQLTEGQKRAVYDKYMEAARSFIGKEDYESAGIQYDNAKQVLLSMEENKATMDTSEVQRGKAKIPELVRGKANFDRLIARGNAAFRDDKDEYQKLQAWRYYTQALGLGYPTPRLEFVKVLKEQTAYSLPLAAEKLCKKYADLEPVGHDPDFLQQLKENIQEIEREMRGIRGMDFSACKSIQ